MWLRPWTQRGTSRETRLNLLWQSDDRPLYLMDNHRAALWCWRRHLEAGEPYGLGHVDYHWDARAMDPADLQCLAHEWPHLDDLQRYDELKSRTREDGVGGHEPLVCWDNYFDALLHLYPRVAQVHVAVHQSRERMGGAMKALQERYDLAVRASTRRAAIRRLLLPLRRPKGPPFAVHSPVRFFEELDGALRGAGVPFVLNLDLDYFFAIGSDEHETVRRAFELPFITECFRTVARHWERLKVVTIALSPECCGGWEAAEVACRAAFEGLGVPYPLGGGPKGLG